MDPLAWIHLSFPADPSCQPRDDDSFLDHVARDPHMLTFGISALPALGQFPIRGSGSARAARRSHQDGKQIQESGAAEQGWAVF